MPRKSRIDAPGALHHIIGRGIERRPIYKDDTDRDDFIRRLGVVLSDTSTHCYAWASPWSQKPKRKRNKPLEKTADELYEDIRNSKTDVANIAKHNNLKPERIQKIKDYVFNNKKFESDPEQQKHG